ncbi:unnamed protein product [Lampetra fluviatilis]
MKASRSAQAIGSLLLMPTSVLPKAGAGVGPETAAASPPLRAAFGSRSLARREWLILGQAPRPQVRGFPLESAAPAARRPWPVRNLLDQGRGHGPATWAPRMMGALTRGGRGCTVRPRP